MHANFSRATNFAAFDLSVWSDRTAEPAFSTGVFPFQGVTYDTRYILPFESGGSQTLTLLGFAMEVSGGALVDGTVSALRILDATGATTLVRMLGFNLPAAEFGTAILTPSRADDRALLNQLLAGDDRLTLSVHADRAFGATGSDTIFGNRGNDFLSGNNGNDLLQGGNGNDTLNGQAHADRLFGGLGADHLFGGLGADRISGGLNADALTGGAGADVFVFSSSDGNDVIRDFENNVDTIEIDLIPNIEWYIDLRPLDGDTVLTIFRYDNPSETLDVRIVIENINPMQLENDIDY